MSLKTLCSTGCTLRINVSAKKVDLENMSILGNVRVTLVDPDGDDCMSIRGPVKQFHSNGNTILDMNNSRDRKFPNTVMAGAEEIVNSAVATELIRVLNAKNVKSRTFGVRYDVKDEKWVKVDVATTNEELTQAASAIIGLIDDETEARPAQQEKKDDSKSESAQKASEALS